MEVLIGKPTNDGFSSKPCLITGGYPPKFDRFPPRREHIVTECIRPRATCRSGYSHGVVTKGPIWKPSTETYSTYIAGNNPLLIGKNREREKCGKIIELKWVIFKRQVKLLEALSFLGFPAHNWDGFWRSWLPRSFTGLSRCPTKFHNMSGTLPSITTPQPQKTWKCIVVCSPLQLLCGLSVCTTSTGMTHAHFVNTSSSLLFEPDKISFVFTLLRSWANHWVRG